MDAFSVSIANGLAAPCMCRRRLLTVAGVFALFQGAMPLIGWFFVHSFIGLFTSLEGLIPWISLALLSIIGGKMIADACKPDEENCSCATLGVGALLVQGIATSIDALSVGFTIAGRSFVPAMISALIITAVTFPICFVGVYLGKHFGNRFSHKAEIFGGVLLILIGIEIFLTGIF
jgi:putative Mn2+ efflux pump MntP